MRRKDRETDRDFALGAVDRCDYANLGLSEAGRPYVVPISVVRRGDAIYFHCARSGRKLDIMRQNPEVCLSCVGEFRRLDDQFSIEYASAICFGRAAEVTDESERREALRLLCERHVPTNMENFGREMTKDFARTAVVRIDVAEMTGKRRKIGADGKELKFGRTE